MHAFPPKWHCVRPTLCASCIPPEVTQCAAYTLCIMHSPRSVCAAYTLCIMRVCKAARGWTGGIYTMLFFLNTMLGFLFFLHTLYYLRGSPEGFFFRHYAGLFIFFAHFVLPEGSLEGFHQIVRVYRKKIFSHTLYHLRGSAPPEGGHLRVLPNCQVLSEKKFICTLCTTWGGHLRGSPEGFGASQKRSSHLRNHTWGVSDHAVLAMSFRYF